MSRQRVAYVVTDPGVPAFGRKGASAHVRAVLGELVARGADVHLFAARRDGDPPTRLHAITIHDLPRPTGAAADRERAAVAADHVLAVMLGDVAGARGFDLVYQRYALWSAAGLELAGSRGWRSVLEINAPLVDEQQQHRVLVDRETAIAMSRRALTAATTPYAVSRAVADWAGDLAGRPIPVVANGVDTDRVRPLAGGTAALPVSEPDELTLGFVGTFKPWHGVESLVAAAAAIHHDPSAPRVRLLLVGDGPQLATVLAHADRAGLQDRVESVGAVDPDDVPAVLTRIDVALAPYPAGEHYFSPLKVFEYMAAGLAVVASGIGEVPDLLQDGRDALVVAPGDDDAFVAAVHRLAVDPTLRARLGAAARTSSEERFSWRGVLDRVLELDDRTAGGQAA